MNSFTEFRTQFFTIVGEAKSIVITAHLSPDDDSIGSVLTLHTYLTTIFPEKNIRILYSGPIVDRWHMIVHFEKIVFVDDITNHLDGVDTLIILDVNNTTRISKFPDRIPKMIRTIIIDHHASLDRTGEAELALIEPTFSSNSELIYRSLIEGEGELTKELAEPILLGVLGDTGALVHLKPGQTNTLLVVKELVEIMGMPIDLFISRYSGIPVNVFPIMQELIQNTVFTSVAGWPAVQYTYVDRSVMEAKGFTDEDMSTASHKYLSNYLPRMIGYSWGFVVTPRSDGECRISSRSLMGSVNVRDMHERLAIGGGHDRAAGGNFTKADPKECLDKVLEWMKNNKPVLG